MTAMIWVYLIKLNDAGTWGMKRKSQAGASGESESREE